MWSGHCQSVLCQLRLKEAEDVGRVGTNVLVGGVRPAKERDTKGPLREEPQSLYQFQS